MLLLSDAFEEKNMNGLIIVTALDLGVESIKTVYQHNYEQKLLEVCKNTVSNWEDHTQDDINDIINDGVYSTVDGKIIALIWLDEDGNYN